MLKKHTNKSLPNHELKIPHEAQLPGEAKTHSATQEISIFHKSEHPLLFHCFTLHFSIQICTKHQHMHFMFNTILF